MDTKTHPKAAGQTQAQQPPKIDFSMSGGLVNTLAREQFSLAFSSYQSGKLYMLGRSPKGGANVHHSEQRKPMGLSYDGQGGLTMAGSHSVVRFENVLAEH